MTKLYNAPRNSFIKLTDSEIGPPGDLGHAVGEVLKFHHVDGMYSFCQTHDGYTTHIPAWAEVEVVNGWED